MARQDRSTWISYMKSIFFANGTKSITGTNSQAVLENLGDSVIFYNEQKSRENVRVATTAGGTLASDFENGDTIDGVLLATGDRILIKDQASASENGVYTVNASGAPTRATDFDTADDVILGSIFYVEEGTANAGKYFYLIAPTGTITVGTSNLVFADVNPFATATEIETGTEATKSISPDSLADVDDLTNMGWMLDEDNMASNDATKVPSQQSVKAYVDGKVPNASTTVRGIVELATTAETQTGTDATRAVTPDGLHDMTSLAGAAWFLDEDNMASNDATKTVSQQSVKAYVDGVVISGGGITHNNTSTYNTMAVKVVEIGDWNMDTTATKNIAHGLSSFAKIRDVTATIRDDSNSTLYKIEYGGEIQDIDNSNILLDRTDSGNFDSTEFDSTSYNRGWVTIMYEDTV